MKHSVALKFIVFFLTAVALVTGVGSVIGIVQLVDRNLYTQSMDNWVHESLELETYNLASSLAERYAVTKESNCSQEILKALGYRYLFEDVTSWSGYPETNFSYTISTHKDGVVDSVINDAVEGRSFTFMCSATYPMLITDDRHGDALYGKDYRRSESLTIDKLPMTVRYYDSPRYTVTVTLLRDAAMSREGTSMPLLELLYELRYVLILVLTGAVFLFPMGVIILCSTAGKSGRAPNELPGAINHIPLDLYAAGCGVLGTLMFSLVADFLYAWTKHGKNFNAGTLALTALLLLGIAFLCLGLLYAAATQIKQSGGYWWRHSFLYWLYKKIRSMTTAMRKRLPLVWRLLGLWIVLLAAVAACIFPAAKGVFLPLILAIVICTAFVCYCAYAFATLLQGARRMAQGNLNAKINTRYLVGSYRHCAEYLNTLADVAIVAARNQMRADRMKTELITNVSHDIKTPLTSIINYVDILSIAETEAQRQQYLEVLGRQSQRLKRLIEDLVELSKASTGNMQVQCIPLDAAETVNQALGEFYDKLEKAGLTVVFHRPEQTLTMLADGRMSWRVLSNLLSNAVKYAMPGTRIYLELSGDSEWIRLSVKNVSRERLTLPVEELTERFVRGDVARNTEGSGLGLNIAQSLMDLQHGRMELQVDGDLFKVTLLFPPAPEHT